MPDAMQNTEHEVQEVNECVSVEVMSKVIMAKSDREEFTAGGCV